MPPTCRSTCSSKWPQKEAVWAVWTQQIKHSAVFLPSLILFNSLQVSWQPCLVFWHKSPECWCQLREGSQGGRLGGGPERERGGGGVSGLFKALVLCLPLSIEEGEAHMHWEKHTCSHTHTHTHSSSGHIFRARSSDWQQQTEWRASTTERRLETREASTEERKGEETFTGFAPFSLF